jgi:hypothetical protein
MKTMFLNPQTWDLAIDASGNIAAAQDPYALAQNAASAIRLFLGEQWYNTTLGVPYLTANGRSQILARPVNVPLMKATLAAVAETVTGVSTAQVFITSIADRNVRGQVQVTDENGTTTAALF